MKRLTPRYKRWLFHRQRYELRRRGRKVARLLRAVFTQITLLYNEVKKKTQRLGCRDSLYVIWAYCQHLQSADFTFPADIEVAPQFLAANPPRRILAEWTLEQITREVIQHSSESLLPARSLRQWNTLADIANTLRDLEGEIYVRLVGKNKVHLEMMRISHREFTWQQHRLQWQLVVRYHKLFNTPALNALSRQKIKLDIDQIYTIGLAYLGHFLNRPFSDHPIKVEIPNLNQASLDNFLRFTCLSVSDLRNRLRGEHALDEGFAYRYSSLREFPLVTISNGDKTEVACPLPTLLLWRITMGLYYSLRNELGFSGAFGKSFQEYVGAVASSRIASATIDLREEVQYWVGKKRKDTVDWIVQQADEAALFIECKTKRLTWASKSGLSDLTSLEHDIAKLGGAVVQTYRTIKDYREGLYSHLPFVPERKIYPLIVTLDDWYFFGFELPVRLDAVVRRDMERAGLSLEWLDDMPYSIMSVEEFEVAVGLIDTAGINSFILGKVNDPAKRFWAYDAYHKDAYKDQVLALPELFPDECDAMLAAVGAEAS